MKKAIFAVALLLAPLSSKADFWGGDLPLLAKIVTHTLNTLMELRKQTRMYEDEMDGIKDRINRIQTIANLVQPSSWDQWRDPREALTRLRAIYHTLPKEYRSAKAALIEDELSKAMNMVSRVVPDAGTTFISGKELERRGADASPGVAQKLTASGVGSLVAVGSQSLVAQSHIISLLAQMLADANERESRTVVSQGSVYSGVAQSLGDHDGLFSTHVSPFGAGR